MLSEGGNPEPYRGVNPGWFPNLTRAYDNNGRCPRQKFVFGILQLLKVKVKRVC